MEDLLKVQEMVSLTQKSLPTHTVFGLSESLNPNDPIQRLRKELYVGGIPPGLTPISLQNFLNEIMRKYGYADDPEDGDVLAEPVLQASIQGDGSYAFIRLRSVEETDRMIVHLNGVPCLTSYLKIGRPKNYTGNGPGPGRFDPNVMALPSLGMADAETEKLIKQLEDTVGTEVVVPPSTVVEVIGMVTEEMLEDAEELKEIGEELYEECQKFGTVIMIRMPEVKNKEKLDEKGLQIVTRDDVPVPPVEELDQDEDVPELDEKAVYIQMDSIDQATTTLEKLNGRTFDEVQLKAAYFAEKLFSKLPQTTTSVVPASTLLRTEEEE